MGEGQKTRGTEDKSEPEKVGAGQSVWVGGIRSSGALSLVISVCLVGGPGNSAPLFTAVSRSPGWKEVCVLVGGQARGGEEQPGSMMRHLIT